MNAARIATVFVGVGLTTAHTLLAAPSAAEPPRRAYSGIDLVERAEGLVVWTLRPGPIDGGLATSSSLARGDLLLTIDGAPATRALWDAAHAQPAGTRVRLGYRPARARDETREVEVVLDEPTLWRGLLGRGAMPARATARSTDATRDGLGRSPLADEFARSVAALGPQARARVDRLTQSLAAIPDSYRDPGTPALLRELFANPTAAEGIVDSAVPPAERWRAAPFRAAAELVAALDGARPTPGSTRGTDASAPDSTPAADSTSKPNSTPAPNSGSSPGSTSTPAPDSSPASASDGRAVQDQAHGQSPDADLPPAHGVFEIAHADAGVWFLDFLLNEARVRFAAEVDGAAARMPGLRPLVVERLDDLLVRGPRSRDAMEALGKIPLLSPREAARIVAHFDVVANLSPEVARGEAVAVPEALAGAIDGAILAASEIPELGWLVVGGPGANRYDLGRIAAVLEVGGNDRYEWSSAAGDHRLVVDLDGNDLHAAAKDAPNGPAAALGAVAVIDDHRGDDRYEGGALTAGAALGVSVLVDRAGDDSYQGGAWSLGAVAGGAALVVDVDGDDRFAADGMALGVGGPSGVGAVVDVAGDDRATLGTRPSVYGVAGEHAGFGMGLGLGFRLSAAGGVGAYLDLAGDDERRSGEFSQGCGYFLGLGILLDAAGDDRAECDRYGLGSAAHQAIGIAIDGAGDDRFVGHTAAHLGGAWDESIAVFLDRLGDDQYDAGSLSLGGAAQQALAIAVDRSGADRRTAGGASFGASSTNEYHFAQAGLGSFAAFLDLAGPDGYPEGRADDTTAVSPEAPAAELREQDGVFVDTNSKPAAAPGDIRPPS